MSIERDMCWRMVLLARAAAVELSVRIGVGGCLCPISSNVVRRTTASLPLKNRPAYSDSAADAMMCRMMLHVAWRGPLGVGGEVGGLVGLGELSLRM